ncbi:MAG: hypothetical protein AAGM38_18085 [Pseudomonadota bacterium]
MKKQRGAKRARRAPKRNNAAPAPTPHAPAPRVERRERRRALLRLRDYSVIGAAAAFGVWWLVDDVQAYRQERDLSEIGAGVASIVQVHDPNCSLCAALQRETRAALRGFDDERLRFRIADITTPEGAAFAQRHRAGHVTLLLFDREGAMIQILSGSRPRAALAREFARHFPEARRGAR